MITDDIIRKIRQIVRYFETSKVEGANYGAYVALPDGFDGRRQITYGASQTTEYGGLKALLQAYIIAADKEGSPVDGTIRNLVSKVGDRSKPSLHTNVMFVAALKRAGNDPIMQKTQDKFFTENYFAPAKAWFDDQGFTLPLSLLVIYDSFIHSGGIPGFLRKRFSSLTPKAGGDEKTWIKEYVNTRDQWLENHSNKVLQNTDYRTDSFIYAIRTENWMLDKIFSVGDYSNKLEDGRFILRAQIR